MKTTLEKPAGRAKYGKKDLVMRLVRVEDKSILGEATIDLANYAKCLERRLFSIELAKSQFPDALIDFYVTASPLTGNGRSYSVRANTTSGGAHSASSDIATSSQVV